MVHPPDEEGARQVTVGMYGRKVRSREELSEFLRGNGLSGDLRDPNQVEWRGGGSRAWGRSDTAPGGENPWKRWITAIALTIGLATASAFFGSIGVKDVSEALSYVGRVGGAALLAVAFVALTAAIAVLVDYRMRRRLKITGPITVVGVLTVLIINTALLFMQCLSHEYTHWLWMWLSLTLWGGWALWELVHRQRIWRDIPQRKKFAAALSVGVIAAAGNFGYTQVYEPYASSPSVTAGSEFGKPYFDSTDRIIHVPVTLRFKNTGKMAVWIIGASYTVMGASWNSAREKTQKLEEWQKNVTEKRELDLHYHTRGRIEYVIGRGILLEPNYSYLEPGDALTEQRVIEMPAEKDFFDSVYVSSEILAIRKDRMKLVGDPENWSKYSWESAKVSAPAWVSKKTRTVDGSANIEYIVPLKYSSEIFNLTRRPRDLTVWWMLGTNEKPAFASWALLAPKGEQREPTVSEQVREWTKYGMVYSNSGRTETPYAQLMAGKPASS